MFGPTDFLKLDFQLEENGFGPGGHNEADSPESKYLGAKITDVPLKTVLANPMTYIHEHMPPILIQHGRLDTLVPVQQSMIFVEKLQKYVSPDRFEFDVVEGVGHADPLFESDENMNPGSISTLCMLAGHTSTKAFVCHGPTALTRRSIPISTPAAA